MIVKKHNPVSILNLKKKLISMKMMKKKKLQKLKKRKWILTKIILMNLRDKAIEK